jgi:hypothetical protein
MTSIFLKSFYVYIKATMNLNLVVMKHIVTEYDHLLGNAPYTLPESRNIGARHRIIHLLGNDACMFPRQRVHEEQSGTLGGGDLYWVLSQL